VELIKTSTTYNPETGTYTSSDEYSDGSVTVRAATKTEIFNYQSLLAGVQNQPNDPVELDCYERRRLERADHKINGE
jgi:hypothetical protein